MRLAVFSIVCLQLVWPAPLQAQPDEPLDAHAATEVPTMVLAARGVVRDSDRISGCSLFPVAALLLVLTSGNTAARTCDVGVEVIRTAVLHLRAELRHTDGLAGERIGFDPRVVEERMLTHPAYVAPVATHEPGHGRSDPETAVLLRALSAVPTKLDEARQCDTPSPRSCSLGDLSAVFATSTPRVVGDSAEVVVMTTWMSNLAKQPVQAGTFHLELIRQDGRWRVRQVRTLSIT